MSDILREIDAILGGDPASQPIDGMLKALSSAKAEIAALRATNAELEKKAEAAGSASTSGPSLADIRKLVRQELGVEPRTDV